MIPKSNEYTHAILADSVAVKYPPNTPPIIINGIPKVINPLRIIDFI